MEDLIIKAGKALKTINIDYEKADGSRGWREVEPYRIKMVNDDLTLYAKNIDKPGIRSFKMDSIFDVEITDNDYSPEWPVEF